MATKKKMSVKEYRDDFGPSTVKDEVILSVKNLKTNWDSSELQKAIQLTIEDNNDECEIQIAKLPNFQKDIFNSIISGKATPEVKKLAQAIFKNEEESLK